MGRCYLCDKLLNNEKKEHIIPNAIGGKLASRHILCSNCNNDYSDIDNKLCVDLELLTNFVCPQRDNNKNTIPSIRTYCGNDEYIRYADGSYRKSNPIEFIDNNTIRLKLRHTPNSQAEKEDIAYIKKFFNQLAKNKHKSRDWATEQLNNALKNASICQTDSGIHRFQFCANKTGYAFLGILKIALGFCIFKKVEKLYLQGAIHILKTRDIALCDKIANFLNDNSVFPKDGIYHTIYLSGNNDSKLLYAIVSLYGVFNSFCLISNDYKGKNINVTYCYDLINDKLHPLTINYDMNVNKAQNILNEKMDTVLATENFNIFMKIIMLKDKQRYLMKILEQVMNDILQLIIMNYSILDEIKYIDIYSKLFKERIKQYPNLNFVSDENIQMFLKIILEQIYTYNLYRFNKEALNLVENTVTILFNVKSKDKCELFNRLREYIKQYRSEIPAVNDLFQNNSKELQNFVVSYYEKIIKCSHFNHLLIES